LKHPEKVNGTKLIKKKCKPSTKADLFEISLLSIRPNVPAMYQQKIEKAPKLIVFQRFTLKYLYPEPGYFGLLAISV
jgi:hypothetical protein